MDHGPCYRQQRRVPPRPVDSPFQACASPKQVPQPAATAWQLADLAGTKAEWMDAAWVLLTLLLRSRTMLPHHFCPQVVAVILAVLFVVLLVVVVAVRCVRRRRLRRQRQGLQLDGDHFSRLQ